jgi:hypothetical protein
MALDVLNPNHAMSQAAVEYHLQLLAVMVHMQGGHVVMSKDDIVSFPQGMCIAFEEKPDGLHLDLVTREAAVELARKHGGLPT